MPGSNPTPEQRARLIALRKKLKLDQEQMGLRLGVSREWVSMIENGHREVSEFVRLKLDQIERDELSSQAGGAVAEDPASYNATPPRVSPNAKLVYVGDEKFYRLPVVSFTHAAQAKNYEEIAKYDQETILTRCNSARAFVLIVEGDCMSPEIKEGDRVVVNPEGLPHNGEACVTRLHDDGVVIRLFHRESPKSIRLISMNRDLYPDILLRDKKDYFWCWPVEEWIRRRRRILQIPHLPKPSLKNLHP